MERKIYKIPFKNFHTFCYTFGDVRKSTPLIILHGGPGGCVERYEPLEQLANYGIPVIFYDQLGCGYSRAPKGNEHLWTFDTFMDELENVIKFFNLKKVKILGHSWGGMLALEWICKRKPNNIEKLILFSTLPSTKIWNDEHLKMIEEFPKEQKMALLNELEGKQYNKKDYKTGLKRFYQEHVSKKSDKKYIFVRKRFPKTNKEIYEKMWGKSELFGTGTLSNYDVTKQLKDINIETLILSGAFDESTPTMNELMNKEIKKSKWILFKKSHHIAYSEEPELVLDEIIKFIK